MSRTLFRASVVFLLLSCWCFAQEFRATVTGHVADTSGAAMPNVAVQITNLETNEVASAVTNAQGVYTLPFLKPGKYRMNAEVAGFKKYIRDNIVLNVGDTAGIDLTMEVGQASESITVAAETPVLQTENAEHGLVLDQMRITELPLNARNPFMLSNLSAGVNFNGNAIYQRPFDNGAIADWSVNGGLDRNNEFLLDGAPNNAQAGGNNIAYVPPVDSVSEFKIQTNSFDAQYGKTSGGIMNVSLKSGTNQFHGTGYEFMRRNDLDANSFQNNAAGKDRSGHFLDQYGGSIGGPLIFPKLYNGRNKSFFFFNYEGYREGTPTPLILSVPQPEFLNGDFSKLVDSQGRKITIYDPYSAVVNADGTVTRTAFPNNQIPANLINPIARNILKVFPAPNTTSPGVAYGVNNLFIPGGADNLDKDDFYNFVTKFDHNINDRHHIFFRFASNDRTEKRNTNGVLGPGWQGPGPLKRINDASVLDYTGTLTPTLILGARVSAARYVEGSRGDPNIGVSPTTLGFPSSLISQLPVQNLFGVYNFSGYTGLGSTPSFNYTNTIAFASSITKVAGSHTVKGGVDLRWIQYNNINVGNPFNFTADNTWTQQQYNRADSLSGNSFASFLLGLPSSGQVDNRIYPSFRDRYFAPYVQDDWKVSRKLTLNLGFRWDFNLLPTERYNRLTRGFDPTATNPINASIDRTAFPGFPTVMGGLLYAKAGQSVANTDLTGLQPRIGGAYQLNDKIVLRGGWGRYYLNPNNDGFRNEGYSITTSLITSNNGGRTPINQLLSTPFPSILVPAGSNNGLASLAGQGFDFFDPTFKLAHIDQFSFGIQYQLPWQSRLEISYNGNRGSKLQTARQYNEPSLAFRQQCNLYEGGNPLFCDQLVANPFYNLPQFAGTNLGTSQTISRFQLARPFPEFGAINQRGRNDGKLWYNAMQLTYGLRARAGLNVTFAYTYSKAIEQGGYDATNSSNGNSNAFNGNNANQAFNDPQRYIPERSVTAYDRPHVVKISTVYQLPVGKGKKYLANAGRLVDGLLGGWEHTTIFQYSSGRPWSLPDNVRYLRDARVPIDWNAPVVQGVRPCVGITADNGAVTLQSYSQNVPGCTLDTLNFVILPRYAPRETPFRTGQIRIDAKPQLDTSLAKTFRFTERMSFQFRAEAFNVTNTYWMPLQQFDNNPQSSTFGQIIKATVGQGNANFPRQIQLGFKFIF